MAPTIVVADTSVIVNFLRIDRMDLLGMHPEAFMTTDHVGVEITASYPEQQERYQSALDLGHVREERIDDAQETEIFVRLGRTGRLGAGERSAIAAAVNRRLSLAIDDSTAIRRAMREAELSASALRIVRTQDIMVRLIRTGAVDLVAADQIRDDWARNHRFRLRIASFSELL
jgi:predicted nucleic acid-binding protein